MKSKLLIRIVAVFLAVLLAGSVLIGVIGAGSVYAVTQSQIDELKQEREELQQKKDDLQAQIDQAESEQAALLAQKALLDERVSLTQQEIENTNAMIEDYTQMIADKIIEVGQCEDAEAEQWEKYKDYIRVMEENGTISYFEILFSATSFSDFLDRMDMIGEIMVYEEQMYQDLGAATEATIQAKEDLRIAKEEQEEAKTSLEAAKADLEVQQQEADAMISELESSIDTYNALYDEMAQQEQAVYEDILAKEEELEQQAQQSSGGSSSSGSSSSGGGYATGTGSLIWPTTSSYVTSPYGYRWHPIYGDYRFHSGIDIGAGYGCSVYAADSGTVITSAYLSGYGECIVISHGNGMTTLYAHMSSRYVSEGESVSQGEVIGAVGSTGNSTGPHLHFEVTSGGSRTDPLNYFSNYTAWW